VLRQRGFLAREVAFQRHALGRGGAEPAFPFLGGRIELPQAAAVRGVERGVETGALALPGDADHRAERRARAI
jgi:hypothetical protein